jgi:hypothetical protein
MSERRIIATRMLKIMGVIAALGLAAAPALGQRGELSSSSERVLIDRSLARSAVRVVGFAGASVSFVLSEAWPGGTVWTRQFSDIAAIIGVGEPTEAPRAGTSIIELVDGTRLLGSLSPAGGGSHAEETGVAQGTSIGDVRFDLDHLARVVFDATMSPAALAPGDADVVELANGDRMEGLVATLWPLVIEDAADAGKKTEVPPERVRQVVMSNKRRESGLSRVWLRDGSVVNVSSFVRGQGGALAGEARVDGNDGVFRFAAPSDRVLALVMSGTRLVPLSQIGVSSYRPVAGRRWAPGPSVVGGVVGGARGLGGDIELSGPMTASWNLPKGSTRFSAGVELSRGARALGMCTLVVEWRGKEIARVDMGGSNASGEVVASLEGGEGELVLTVQPGPRGPVQNDVVLRQAMVLVEDTHEAVR